MEKKNHIIILLNKCRPPLSERNHCNKPRCSDCGSDNIDFTMTSVGQWLANIFYVLYLCQAVCVWGPSAHSCRQNRTSLVYTALSEREVKTAPKYPTVRNQGSLWGSKKTFLKFIRNTWDYTGQLSEWSCTGPLNYSPPFVWDWVCLPWKTLSTV